MPGHKFCGSAASFSLPSNAVACLPHGLPSAFYHTTRVCLLESIFPIKQACRYSGSWLAASYSGANAARRRPWLRKPPTASTRPPRSMSDGACLAVYPQLPLSPQLTPFLSACVPFIEFMCCRCAVISCAGPAEQSRVRKSFFHDRALYILAICVRVICKCERNKSENHALSQRVVELHQTGTFYSSCSSARRKPWLRVAGNAFGSAGANLEGAAWRRDTPVSAMTAT